MFKFLKDIKNKASVSNSSSSLMDIDALKEAKSKVQQRDQDRGDESVHFYALAVNNIENFKVNKNENELRLAVDNFQKSLSFQRNMIDSYLGLAYIAYLFQEDNLTFQYLRAAESINPNYEKTKELKSLIGKF